MEKLTAYVDQFRRDPNIPHFISFAISPETGEQAAVDKFCKAIISSDPTIVQAAIENITDNAIPLHIAAQGLTEFMKKKEFRQPNSDNNLAKFFETSAPIEESLNYMTLTREGLAGLLNKAQQPQYHTPRSYQQETIEACFKASIELISDSIDRSANPIPDEFLQQCSFGPLILQYFDSFTTNRQEIYCKCQQGISLLYEHGSQDDRLAIDHIRQGLFFYTRS